MNNFQLPRRLQGVQPTLIRRIFEKALPDSINFGLGEPDLPTPEIVRRAAARVAVEEANGYTAHAGLPELRKLIAGSYPTLGLQSAQTIVTVGSNEAMFVALMSLAQEGDEILMPNPGFPAYPAIAAITGATQKFYRMPVDDDFGFDADEFAAQITDKTKVVVVISPSNPTGKTLSETDLRQIAEILRDSNAFVLSDEIYQDLYYGAQRPASMADFYENTVIVSGLSKSMSMTGWRLGWLASKNQNFINAALVLHGFNTVCASTISQKAALAAWTDEATQATENARQIYKKRRDVFVDLLDRELNVRAVVPDGAFYVMADFRLYGDDVKLAENLLEQRVITVPGIAFGDESKGFLRLSFCSTEETLTEGVRRIKTGL